MARKYRTVTLDNTATFGGAGSAHVTVGTAFVRDLDSFNVTFTHTATTTVNVVGYVMDGTAAVATGFLGMFDQTAAIDLVSGSAGYRLITLKYPNNIERIRFGASCTATVAVNGLKIRIDGKTVS